MQSNNIRQHFRQLRRNLTATEQKQHAQQVKHWIHQTLSRKKNKRVAAYLATQGEISVNAWITEAAGHHIYLPKLYEHTQPELRFAPLNTTTRWSYNRFSIAEPDNHWGDTLHARQLDYILLPLVAFDRHGRRMGMGGGYYDRTLAFRNRRTAWLSPKLIGIAHSLQEHEGLPENPWDVRLDMIITEKEIIHAKV